MSFSTLKLFAVLLALRCFAHEALPPSEWPTDFVYARTSFSLKDDLQLLKLCRSSLNPEDEKRIEPLLEEKRVHPRIKLCVLMKGHPIAHLKTKAGHSQRGVFATAPLPEGETLGEYVGEIVLREVGRPLNASPRCFSEYAWRARMKEHDVYVEPRTAANELAFVNDYRGIKEKPNVMPKWVAHRGLYYFCYVTERAIAAGEELLTDYWAIVAQPSK